MKKRINITISCEALNRLENLEKNAHNIYGRKCNKSNIVETLIMNTKDRLAMIKERKQQLAKEMNFLTEEEDAIEKVRGIKDATPDERPNP